MKKYFVLLAILMLTVTACGGAGGGNNTPAGENNNNTGGSNLPQTITSNDGRLTMNYPEGWTATSQFGSTINFASSAELTDSDDMNSVPAGQVMVIADANSMENMPDMSLTELASMMSTSIAGENGSLGEPTEFDLNGKQAVSLTGRITPQDAEVGAYILLVEDTANNVILSFVAAAAPGEEGNHVDTVRAMASSATFTAAAEATEEADTDVDATEEADAEATPES